MLAAIGLIIIIKQIPVLLNISPEVYLGQGIVEMLFNIPKFILDLDFQGSIIGILSLLIMLFWDTQPDSLIKRAPAPLIVLLVAVPLQLFFNFSETHGSFSLLQVGNLVDNISLNVDFSGISKFSPTFRVDALQVSNLSKVSLCPKLCCTVGPN